MSLLFIDGFDAQDLTTKWQYIAGGGSTSYQTGASTAYGYGSCWKSAEASGGPTYRKTIAPSATVVVGYRFKDDCTAMASSLGDPHLIIRGDSGSTQHLGVVVNPSGTGNFGIYRGTTLIASSGSGTFVNSTWQYLELKATISATAGYVELRVNGVTVCSFTGNTKNGGTSTNIDAIDFKGNTFNYAGLGTASNPQSNGYYFDDCYILNGTGSVNNDFLGEVRVQCLMPTGTGSSTQFTPTGSANNWDNVNDVPPATGTYNASATVGQRDTYALADLTGTVGTIYAVQDVMEALKSDAGTANLKFALKSGAGVYYDATQSLLSSPNTTTAIRETDPATSAAWTTSGVNALEAGAEVA